MRKLAAIGLIILAAGSCGKGAGLITIHGSMIRAGGPIGLAITQPPVPHPEAGVQLTLIPTDGSNMTRVTTDSAGAFTARLESGRYRVVIDGPGADAFADDKPIQPQPGVITVSPGKSNVFSLVISII